MRLLPGGPGSVRVLCCRHAQGDGPSCGCGRPGIEAEASAICVHVVRCGRVVRRRSASPFPYSRELGARTACCSGVRTRCPDTGTRRATGSPLRLITYSSPASPSRMQRANAWLASRKLIVLLIERPSNEWVGAPCRAMACYRQGAYPVSRGSPLGAHEWPAFCTVSGRRDRIRSWLEQMVEQGER